MYAYELMAANETIHEQRNEIADLKKEIERLRGLLKRTERLELESIQFQRLQRLVKIARHYQTLTKMRKYLQDALDEMTA